MFFFFFSSRRRHTRLQGDWSSDVCSSDLTLGLDRARTTTFVPPLGVRRTPRRVGRAVASPTSLSSRLEKSVESRTFISYRENAIPRHLRFPPPKGNHSLGPYFLSKNRSGRKTAGSG